MLPSRLFNASYAMHDCFDIGVTRCPLTLWSISFVMKTADNKGHKVSSNYTLQEDKNSNLILTWEISQTNWSRQKVYFLFPVNHTGNISLISKFLAQRMIFQLSDWFPKPMIWAIIIKFDQIKKNWWRISCAEILEVGKNFFAASSVKKMSRFEEVSPEEIKRIAWKFTKTVVLLGLAGEFCEIIA